MTSHPDEARIEVRSHLSPEEIAAGSDDPHRQAEIILEDSDDRMENREEAARESHQTPN